ncbi:NmrA family NAD(P)-binding protein [Halobium salinum]|uniref:NmrA family NAD(P)-binding protein n=1 Tax=Halobium salinum TaxID=1364940 RepID=A0ABD5P9J1_9EURY|nr:NmrA family NAD(P)-binding protein [Halobium salinum]
MTSPKVLVTDPVGAVGSAVVDHLLSAEREGERTLDTTPHGATDARPIVYALVDDPDTEAGRRLAGRGVRLVRGTLWNRPSLDRAMRGMDGVFLTTPTDRGTQPEIAAGENAVDAAAAAGVAHLVFCSSTGAAVSPPDGRPDPKRPVEGYLRELGLPSTVLRPTFRMDRFRSYWADALDGTIGLPLPEGVRLSMVDARGVGAVAAAVLREPGRFVGRDITVAGDRLTLPEIAEEFSLVLGRPVRPVHLPPESAEELFGVEAAAEFRSFEATDREVDTSALERETGVELRTLKEYLGDAEWAERPSEAHER